MVDESCAKTEVYIHKIYTMRLYDLQKIAEDGKLDQVTVHMSYDNGAYVEKIDVDLETLCHFVVDIMRRDGVIPIDGD